MVADTRTDAEKLADLTLYGACEVCRTPRTVTRTFVLGAIMMSLVCPNGCMLVTEEGGTHA